MKGRQHGAGHGRPGGQTQSDSANHEGVGHVNPDSAPKPAAKPGAKRPAPKKPAAQPDSTPAMHHDSMPGMHHDSMPGMPRRKP